MLIQLYVNFEQEPEGVWTIVDYTRRGLGLGLLGVASRDMMRDKSMFANDKEEKHANNVSK